MNLSYQEQLNNLYIIVIVSVTIICLYNFLFKKSVKAETSEIYLHLDQLNEHIQIVNDKVENITKKPVVDKKIIEAPKWSLKFTPTREATDWAEKPTVTIISDGVYKQFIYWDALYVIIAASNAGVPKPIIDLEELVQLKKDFEQWQNKPITTDGI